MTLAAAQVVNAVAARLTGLPLTGSRVYTSRAWPLAEADLPAWRVTAETEEVERTDFGGRINQHRLQVRVQGLATATDDLDTKLHELTSQGLAAIFGSTPPHDLALELIDRQLTAEGPATVGTVFITLRATFFVDEAAPDNII